MNAVDISHINYVHDFANENNGLVSDINVITSDRFIDCFADVNPKPSSPLTVHMQPLIVLLFIVVLFILTLLLTY